MESNMINKIPSRQTPVFHVSQGDVGRRLDLELYDGMERETIPADSSIRIRYRRQDGSISSFGVNVGYPASTIYVILPEDVATVPGHIYCKMTINGIGYKAFFIEVEGR